MTPAFHKKPPKKLPQPPTSGGSPPQLQPADAVVVPVAAPLERRKPTAAALVSRPALKLDVARLGIFGTSGSGKSTHAKNLVARAQATGMRVIAVDPNNEWSQVGRESTDRELGPLAEMMYARELAHMPRKVLEPQLSLAVVPDGPLPKDSARALELCAQLIQAAHEQDDQPTLLVLEEVGFYADHCKERLKSVGTKGRHDGLRLIVVAQRPALVPIHLRSQLERLDLFQLNETADVEAIELRCGPELAESLQHLRPYAAVTWRPGNTHRRPNQTKEEDSP